MILLGGLVCKEHGRIPILMIDFAGAQLLPNELEVVMRCGLWHAAPKEYGMLLSVEIEGKCIESAINPTEHTGILHLLRASNVLQLSLCDVGTHNDYLLPHHLQIVASAAIERNPPCRIPRYCVENAAPKLRKELLALSVPDSSAPLHVLRSSKRQLYVGVVFKAIAQRKG